MYEIKIEFFVEGCVDCIRTGSQKERIAIGRRPHDGLCGDVGASARSVLDDEWLTEALREPLADQSGGDVDPSAGSVADEDAHRPGRIGFRTYGARYRQDGSRRRQIQKSTTP